VFRALRFEWLHVARVFPSLKRFVDDVIREGIWGASDFPSGPYPADRLVYRSVRIVEYETPPHAEGLGTRTRMEPNDDPMCGVALLRGDTPNLLQLAVRLPSTMTDLEARIIQQFELEN